MGTYLTDVFDADYAYDAGDAADADAIPHICHFFYTHTFWGLKILHSKVRKFTTKIASRQNSVNLGKKLPRDKNSVNYHHREQIDIFISKTD